LLSQKKRERTQKQGFPLPEIRHGMTVPQFSFNPQKKPKKTKKNQKNKKKESKENRRG